MYILKSKYEVSDFVSMFRSNSKTIGFVPTMGALHKGHIALIYKALEECDICIASIFVNPTQFNNPDDLEKYPRTEAADFAMLEQAGCHAVFFPSVLEMYPEPDTRVFEFDGLDAVMEGAFRPGHFNGVAQVVSKLFDAVRPNKAFFGQKDFQQLAVIRLITKKYLAELNIEIVACETVRESDGLAMSSRNVRLTPECRHAAADISRILVWVKSHFTSKSVEEIHKFVQTEFAKQPLLHLEYFEIADNDTLTSITEGKILTGRFTACIAAYAGDVRLIDNMPL